VSSNINQNLKKLISYSTDKLKQMTLRGGYNKHALGQVAYLFNKVILCIKGHAVMFVHVYIIISLVNRL